MNRSDGNHPVAKEEPAPMQLLLDVAQYLVWRPRDHFVTHLFHVPEGASRVGLVLSFPREEMRLFVSLHDPEHGFRGNRMPTSGDMSDEIVMQLWVAPDDASEGAMPGGLPAGEWEARVNIRRVTRAAQYRLQVYARFGTVTEARLHDFPESPVVRTEEGWYKGELHSHSTESDGKYPVSTVLQAAGDAGLDYLSLTDHITVSQWHKLNPLVNNQLALIRACEVTSLHQGHANLHGIQEWVDVFVDRPGNGMNRAADAAHAQGGLFCVNHPFSGDLGWRADDFDWSRADLMEIYHNLEGPNNDSQLPLWDHHLRVGRRLVGVGGIDSHDPFVGIHRLGELVTWVHAPELSERGIIEGLRGGRVYVSRGPELRFTAVASNGERAEMWESLPLDRGPVRFEVEVKSAEPLRLFVLKNGYPFDSFPLEARDGGWQTLAFSDDPEQCAYYRLELHAVHQDETYPGIQWRDFTTMRALSNPIWIGRESTGAKNESKKVEHGP
jgi:hypothetical protein